MSFAYSIISRANLRERALHLCACVCACVPECVRVASDEVKLSP